MSDSIDFIDDYFTGALSESERQAFEARCSTDEVFATEVAFYVSARQSVRDVLLEQKRQQWTAEETALGKAAAKPTKKSVILRLTPYLAAACLLFAIAFSFLFGRNTPQRITANYLETNYADIKQNMDASKDSLQLGISEYNNKHYNRSLTLFEWVGKEDSTNYFAKKYAGLAYLQLKDYSNALKRFRELSVMKSVYNAGDILQASTLLQRNAPGDEEAAKVLLQKVVQQGEEGNAVAKEALDKWK